MSHSSHTKVAIIGSGPAGYTAAIYAARANLNPMLISGHEPGGQLMITTDVENYPGFADPVQGPWLMEQFRDQAKNVGTELVTDYVTEINTENRPFVLSLESGGTVTADTVVLATGAQARWLGLESEKTFAGLGVSACATCDGFFFRGKRVAVVGGGNSAIEEALFLANLAEHVTIIHRRDELRAERIMQDRVFKNPKIDVLWDHVLEEIKGVTQTEASADNPPGVNALRVRNVKTNEEQDLPADGVFIAIGHDPATALVKGKVKMDDAGYVITAPDSTATDVPGLFAAGDVGDSVYRQAVTAAGMGCMAALEADRYLQAMETGQDPKDVKIAAGY